MKRCVFITGHAFGTAALEGILSSTFYSSGVEISSIVSLSESRRSATVGYQSPVFLAHECGIPHWDTPTIKAASFVDRVRDLAPDYIFVVGWSELAPRSLLDIPKAVLDGAVRRSKSYGCIGMHPTLLPLGRGRAPIPWTIIKGLTRSGVTAFTLEDAPDAGSILVQKEFEIPQTANATWLFEQSRRAHFDIGLELADRIANDSLSPRNQDEQNATIWPKRTPADSKIDLNSFVSEIVQLVRAQSYPYPRAYLEIGADRFRVQSAAGITPQISGAHGPGEDRTIVRESDRRLLVRVRDGAVLLHLVEHLGPNVPT